MCGSRPGGTKECCTSVILASGRSCSEVGMAPCFIKGKLVTPSRLSYTSESQQRKLCFCVLRRYSRVTITGESTTRCKVPIFGAAKCVRDTRSNLFFRVLLCPHRKGATLHLHPIIRMFLHAH